MDGTCSRLIATLVTAAVLALPRGASAQGAVTTDISGGIGIPAGDLAGAVDVGPAFTIGLNFPVREELSLRAEGGADLFRGKDDLSAVVDGTRVGSFEGPDVSHARLSVGLVLHAVAPEAGARGLWLDADVGAGIDVLTTETFREQTGPSRVTTIDESTAYFGMKGGADLGYAFSETVAAFVAVDAHLAFADEADWQELVDFGLDPFGSVWSFPLQVGLKFHFQP